MSTFFCGIKETTWNSVPWNKNISKHLEFCSEPFRERDNISEFRNYACLGRKQAVNSVCWSMIFCKKKFFDDISFHFKLRNRSSVNLGMPRNEHFLPWNKENCSESIPRNFFGTKFRCQPYLPPPSRTETLDNLRTFSKYVFHRPSWAKLSKAALVN